MLALMFLPCGVGTGMLLSVPHAVAAEAPGVLREEEVVGGLSSEAEDKLLEVVRQIETRVGGAAGGFLPTFGSPEEVWAMI